VKRPVFTTGPKSQVPSPTHVGKSLNMDGGEVLTFELQETIEIWLIMIKGGCRFYYIKVFIVTCVES
jgi:hypothetical protein